MPVRHGKGVSVAAMKEMVVYDSMGYMSDMSYNGMDGDGMMYGTEQQVSKADELMSSWVFVGGVTAGVLVLGVLLGLFCAKRKIKKGIDLYED